MIKPSADMNKGSMILYHIPLSYVNIHVYSGIAIKQLLAIPCAKRLIKLPGSPHLVAVQVGRRRRDR